MGDVSSQVEQSRLDYSPESAVGAETAAAIEAKLVVDAVTITYSREGQRLVAVDGLSMTVNAGEFVSIVGPSGCGKTTVLMAMDGLVPITRGQIRLDDRVVKKPGKDRAVVFQDASLLPWRSVLGNVMFAMQSGRQRGRDRGRRARYEERARELLDLVDLTDFASSYPGELSGGMRQRVNLVRALAASPEVLLLDEPFASLDSQTRQSMQEELQRVLTVEKTTAVLITHQIDEAVYLSDRVLVFGARPAKVMREFAIPLPRPRLPEHRDTQVFTTLEHEINSLVRSEYERARSTIDGHRKVRKQIGERADAEPRDE
jgi:NitT/TauT family transport system ATP-binding protein